MEQLFGFGERRARQLMAGLPGIRAGNAAAISLTIGGSQIEFRGVEGLAAKLLELSQVVANDWSAFMRVIE